jgi:PAS domain S-box-containing protein
VNGWNAGAEALFGYSEAEILGQRADILFTPDDRAKGDAEREMRRALEHGRAENERWHARKDGSIFYGSGSVMPLRDKGGGLRGFVKIMRDLTETKRTQEALREHVDELTRFNAAAVGRETRMIELKKEVNELCARLGEKARYVLERESGQELES